LFFVQLRIANPFYFITMVLAGTNSVNVSLVPVGPRALL